MSLSVYMYIHIAYKDAAVYVHIYTHVHRSIKRYGEYDSELLNSPRAFARGSSDLEHSEPTALRVCRDANALVEVWPKRDVGIVAVFKHHLPQM